MNSSRNSVFILTFFSAIFAVNAQSLRDPTVPPLGAGLTAPALNQKPGATAEVGMSLIVREGVFYLVQGTRLFAQGQKLGEARIERLSETEVWLREGGVLRKLPLFPGIQISRSSK
jgi:hypothetical protein